MLEIRLLGELEVVRDGAAVPLPASRKSRALLAYLVATRRAHLRERLCELLWEGPDDPRAALRWSLTKLRPMLEPHLDARRDRVEFRCDGVLVDIGRICTPASATTEQIEQSAALFRGEFVDGLDLPACFRYQQWCAAERERLRQTHVAILSEVMQRHGRSEAALPHARRRVMIDPFNDEAHAALIRLLAALGHHPEAIQQYEHCRSLFERELSSRPGPAVEEARRTIWSAAAVPALSVPRKESSAVAAALEQFIGREEEIRQIESSEKPVVIFGEPGIGKSRLLDEVRRRTAGDSIYGRAFAAEMARPYGLWVDALGDFPTETDRTRLFDAVVKKLEGTALIAVDDIQWIDEASAALLHYIARSARAKIVCAARVGEIDDNPHATRLKNAMRVLHLGPLTDAEVRSLVRDERAAQLSGGNPLFAIELSRSERAGSLSEILSQRLAQLQGPAAEVVSWAAAVGRQFDAEIVGRATGMPAGEMLGALEKLERCAIIRPAGERSYDFVHDLLRDAAYARVTGPRRPLIHRHIARALKEIHDPDGFIAGEILHHATLAGDHEMAAAAAVRAGNRCLRMFAYGEAISVARLGLQMTQAIDIRMKLLNVIVMSRAPSREKMDCVSQIVELMEAARRAGMTRTASLGSHLLACLYEEANRYHEAAGATIQAAELSRTADPATTALAMANAARCLLTLQHDVTHAASLLQQAQALGLENPELQLGIGFLHAHQGRPADATPYLERALELSAKEQDHWREWIALCRLATLALEVGDPQLALRHCARLRPVAAKMTGGSEAVRSDVLEIVAQWQLGQNVDLNDALARLREVDSKSDLAWVLCYLAQDGRGFTPAQREAFAREALVAAETVGRASEEVIARCILGLPAKASPNITARARRLLKESKHGHPRSRAHVRTAHDARRAQ